MQYCTMVIYEHYELHAWRLKHCMVLALRIHDQSSVYRVIQKSRKIFELA